MVAQQHTNFSRLLFFINISMNSCCLYVSPHPWVPQNKRNRHFQAIPIDLDLDI